MPMHPKITEHALFEPPIDTDAHRFREGFFPGTGVDKGVVSGILGTNGIVL